MYRQETNISFMNRVLAGLRPYEDSDIDKLAHLLADARAWPPATPSTPSDLINRWARRGVIPQRDVRVLVGPSDDFIAFSQASLFRDGTARLSFDIGVAPAYRRRGIGTALYQLIIEHARQLGAGHLTAPVFVAPGESRPESVHFLHTHGFRADYSYWQMRIDDIHAQPAAPWPDGISFRTLTPLRADTERWAQLINAAFGEPATATSIEAQLAEPGTSSEGYLFAVDKRTCLEVGTSRARIDVVGGRPVGYVGTVGVLPAYRRRGIAAALVRQTLDYLAAHGVDSATLFVEDRNTPARRLYDKMGWYAVYRTDHYWKRMLEYPVQRYGG